jgi:hypothetical protein
VPADALHNGHPDDTVVVLFGATGDLAARKLIPGFYRLHHAGLMPRKYRIIGTSPIEMDTDGFRAHAHDAVHARLGVVLRREPARRRRRVGVHRAGRLREGQRGAGPTPQGAPHRGGAPALTDSQQLPVRPRP